MIVACDLVKLQLAQNVKIPEHVGKGWHMSHHERRHQTLRHCLGTQNHASDPRLALTDFFVASAFQFGGKLLSHKGAVTQRCDPHRQATCNAGHRSARRTLACLQNSSRIAHALTLLRAWHHHLLRIVISSHVLFERGHWRAQPTGRHPLHCVLCLHHHCSVYEQHRWRSKAGKGDTENCSSISCTGGIRIFTAFSAQ